MISNALHRIADRLAEQAVANQPLTPQQCATLSQELRARAEQAEHMEATPFEVANV